MLVVFIQEYLFGTIFFAHNLAAWFYREVASQCFIWICLFYSLIANKQPLYFITGLAEVILHENESFLINKSSTQRS